MNNPESSNLGRINIPINNRIFEECEPQILKIIEHRVITIISPSIQRKQGSQPEAIFTSTPTNQRAPTQLSAMPNFPSHEDHPKPRLPDITVTANSLHATPQTAKLNKRQAPHQRLSDMGLRTVYVQIPNNRLPSRAYMDLGSRVDVLP
ncbi:hypothetical protein TNCV_404421 [Trichonephila clavipes]|nr:hypothetical protein TNCV_404421 [Trichonephila clavipes]